MITVACTPTSPASACAYGCTAALAYLRQYARADYALYCPGAAYNSDGSNAQGLTCNGSPGFPCYGRKFIAIREPCSICYRNEAANSIGMWNPAYRLDPYGPSC